MLASPYLFNNSVDAVLAAAGVSAAILLFFWLIRLVARRRKVRAQRSETDLDNLAVDLADRSKLFLLLFPALYLGARFLIFPPELGRLLRMLAKIAAVGQIALWVSAVVDFWIARYRRTRATADPSASATINIFRIGAIVAIWLVATLVAIENLGFNVTTVVASLGIGGVAVALAMQNILGDLLASLSIIIDKPFVVGDAIAIDNHSGTVEHIGMKTTRIRSVSGEELIISNGDLLKSRIRNFHRMTRRRAVVRLTLRFDVEPEKLERVPMLLRAAIEKHPGTTFDRAHFTGIGEGGFDFEAVYFVESPDFTPFADAQQSVQLDLVRTMAAEEIHLAPRPRATI